MTRTYLEAEYAYEQAVTEHVAASKADVEALADRLEHECPDVLNGAFKLERVLSTANDSPQPSARQRGEQHRQARQLVDVESEISLALAQAKTQPYRQAELSFVHAVRSLRWSDWPTAAILNFAAATLELQLHSASPQVCADLRYWAASNYESLSDATRTLGYERERLFDPLVAFAFALPQVPPTNFEDSRDRTLARKTARLTAERGKTESAISAIEGQLQSDLGLSAGEKAEAQKEHEAQEHEKQEHEKQEHEELEQQTKEWVVVAKGATAAGGAYKIEVKRGHPGAKQGRHRCIELNVTESIREADGGRSSGSEVCVSRTRPQAPTVACDSGLLTIEAQTVPSARRVSLALSSGRQITSPVAVVPPKLGGPVGYYHQALWGPSPIPVELIELSASGRVLRRLTLPRKAGCWRPLQPRNPISNLHVVARGEAPQGLRFLVIADRESIDVAGRRLALPRHRSSMRDADVHVVVLISGSGFSSERDTLDGVPSRIQPARPFVGQVATGCQPHEYAIVYGLLRDPRDRVLARTASGLVPLRDVRMPASLHTRDVLAYAALPSVPSEVFVRSPAGEMLGREDLTARVKQVKEMCEGEAEPAL